LKTTLLINENLIWPGNFVGDRRRDTYDFAPNYDYA